MLLPDEELVRQSQKGNIDAFEELIEKYQLKIYNLCYRLMGNPHDAYDLSQEALIKTYKGIGKFRMDASFSTWIYHITINVCRDELRKRSRHQVSSLDEPLNLEEGEVSREVADTSMCPEDTYEQKEAVEYIQGLINSLNHDYRMVIILRENMGYTYEEISVKLNITLGTVKSRLNRARKQLKDKILKDREQSSTNL